MKNEKIRAGAFQPFPVVPIALAGALVNGVPNYTTVGFLNGVNINPPILYVSLNRRHHTPKGILENKTFSVNIPSVDYVVETDYCGLFSGKVVDKSSLFTTFYGDLGTAPMIQEFPVTCECRLTGTPVEFPDDIVYFGEVVQVYFSAEAVTSDHKPDLAAMRPLIYAGLENKYRTLGDEAGTGWSIGRQYNAAGTHTAC